MVVTLAVLQLPMFWLNADAEWNTCRADPTPSPHSAAHKAEPAGHATPLHAAAPYIALQSTTMQQAVLHRTTSLQQAAIHR
jgi:hypothetical protein